MDPASTLSESVGAWAHLFQEQRTCQRPRLSSHPTAKPENALYVHGAPVSEPLIHSSVPIVMGCQWVIFPAFCSSGGFVRKDLIISGSKVGAPSKVWNDKQALLQQKHLGGFTGTNHAQAHPLMKISSSLCHQETAPLNQRGSLEGKLQGTWEALSQLLAEACDWDSCSAKCRKEVFIITLPWFVNKTRLGGSGSRDEEQRG